MLELEEIVHQLAQKDEITIRGEVFRLKNAVTATDGNVLKMRLVLESISSIDNIEVDVGISAKVYKR